MNKEQKFINSISISNLAHRLDQIIEFLNLGNTLFICNNKIPENDIVDIHNKSIRDKLRCYNELCPKYLPEIHVKESELLILGYKKDFYRISLNKDGLYNFLEIFHYMLETLYDIKMPEFIGPLIKG